MLLLTTGYTDSHMFFVLIIWTIYYFEEVDCVTEDTTTEFANKVRKYRGKTREEISQIKMLHPNKSCFLNLNLLYELKMHVTRIFV